jgi:single stranded DNA-binding protein
MAVNVNFIGRLGADCEVKVNAKNGKQFVSFRVATDEFKNGKNETTWLSVMDFNEKALKMSPYLKKGSMVCVHGSETVSIYQSKNGEYVASRDIMSDRLDFVSGGSGNTATTKVESATDEMNCGTLKSVNQIEDQTKIVNLDNPQLMGMGPSNDDDLPF